MRVVTCPSCSRLCPATTYNRVYCSVRCRRAAQYAKERDQQRAGRVADWTGFWAAVGDVPTLGDEAILKRRDDVLGAKSR